MQRDPPRRLQFCLSRIWANPDPSCPARGAATLQELGQGWAPLGASSSTQGWSLPPEGHPGTGRELPHVQDGTEWKANTPTQRKLSAKRAELKPGQDLSIFNQWHLCQLPLCHFHEWPLEQLYTHSAHWDTAATGKSPPCFHKKTQHRSSVGVTVSMFVLISHSWTYITCKEPGESVPVATYWYFQRKTLTGLCSPNRNTSQYPTKDTVSVRLLQWFKLATNHLQSTSGEHSLHTVTSKL